MLENPRNKEFNVYVLDEVFPEIPLMPDTHFKRAKARIWIDYCSNRYLPACSQLMRDRNNPQEQEKNLENLREIFLYMERECFDKNNGGKFWMGENITLVDLHFAPFFERFGAYENLFDAQWPEECENIRSWWSAMQERKSYQDTFLPLASHIETYTGMMQRFA